MVIGDRPIQVPFRAHVELLQMFLRRRAEIVERLEGLLNAQRKPLETLQDGPLLARYVGDCFFSLSAITPDQVRLRGRLEEAHRASGFKPPQSSSLPNGLVDPGEMMARGFHLWRQTRWPGRNARLRYAHTLFNLFVLRCLALLSMRVWDGGTGSAAERLAEVQAVLDELWRSQPADQPVLVRDARWLIPVAQSPTNDELMPYFEVAASIAESFSKEDRNEIHRAAVLLAGGHLRSQLHHYCTREGVSLSDRAMLLNSRKSNALDFALLIHDLVPLLEAYERACQAGEGETRLALADAICQGISPDPELFVNRLDLLRPYSMIEHVFIGADAEDRVDYTFHGRRHRRLFAEYEARLGRMSASLCEDCSRFRPIAGGYSPYGVLFGFASNLIEHMAFKTLQPDAETGFALEDAFTAGKAAKLAWVSGWRKLPHIEPEVQRLFDYPQQFAEEIFARIEDALQRRAFKKATSANAASANGVSDNAASANSASTGAPRGRLFVLPEKPLPSDRAASPLPDLPARYVGASDLQMVAAQKAEPYEQTELVRGRREGYFLVVYETPGGWAAITKDLLTDFVGAGREAQLAGLPATAAEVLKLMLPDIVVP